MFAIDGSKVHVPPSFIKFGCKSRTNDQPVTRIAKRPLLMLSSMFDVNSRTCYDLIVSTHFNERTSVMHHMKKAKAGDTMIFDRGYYSKQLLQYANKLHIRVLFRLKRDAFIIAKKFYSSSATLMNVKVLTDSTSTQAFLFKYLIEGKVYMYVHDKFCYRM